MKRTVCKILCFLSLVTMLPAVSSCSFIFGGEEGYAISDVQQSTDKDGNIVLTITYTDEDIEPLVVTLPKGLAGKDGVGIQDVDSSVEGDVVTLTIHYTDASVPDTVLSFPILQGEDGKGIESVDVSLDENGNSVLTFAYSDGTKSEAITIPKAKDGTDGVGIQDIVYGWNEETGNYDITISYTDGRDSTTISIPPAKDGVGILSIVYSELQSDEENYGLVITYDDGTAAILRIPRPVSSRWYYGEGKPEDDVGNSGDYYIDTTTGKVYGKGENGWGTPLFSMKGTGATDTSSYCTIYFDANGGVFEDGLSIKYLANIEVGTNVPLEGEKSFGSIGTPTYEGYFFTGWFTSPEDEAISGQFTDLTPVYGDQLTLYAHWEIAV